MSQTEHRYVRIRCGNGHERTIGFYDEVEEGQVLRHIAYVRAAINEVFPSYDDTWRGDGKLPSCPCGAVFLAPVETVGTW